MCMWMVPVETRRRCWIPLELELQMVVSHQMGMLGTKLNC